MSNGHEREGWADVVGLQTGISLAGKPEAVIPDPAEELVFRTKRSIGRVERGRCEVVEILAQTVRILRKTKARPPQN
jgi:hypothetical protein